MNTLIIYLKTFILISIFAGFAGCNRSSQALPDTWFVHVTDSVRIDAVFDEWDDLPVQKLWADQVGRYPMPEDLEAWFRIALTSEGIALNIDVKDDFHTSDSAVPWNGDAVELFFSPARGHEDIYQISLNYSDGKVGVTINDHRKSPAAYPVYPDVQAAAVKDENLLSYEISVPLAFLGDFARGFAMQVYIDDADKRNDNDKHSIQWYPVGHSYNSSFSMWQILPATAEPSWTKGVAKTKITDNRDLDIIVFGTVKRDVIEIQKGSVVLLSKASHSTDSWMPEIIRLPEGKVDLENDTISVLINGEIISWHDLFSAPRVYQDSTPKNFEREIRTFRQKDRLSFPEPGKVLFVGSSSIRMWYTLRQDFPELDIIHRGFGGSTSEEALLYINDIVLPYKPSTIVYYEGDNDIPRGLTSAQIRQNMTAFINQVLLSDTTVNIYLLSPKPSVSRMHLWKKYQEVHRMMRELDAIYPQVHFVDVSTVMFQPDGKLNKSIFIADGVHMNAEGYKLWTALLRKELGLPN